MKAKLTFVPAPDRNHSCVGCIGQNNTPVCQALPDCMGVEKGTGKETMPGSKGHGVIWVLQEPTP